MKLFRGLFQGSILGGLRGEICGDFDDLGSSLGLHFGGRGWKKCAPKNDENQSYDVEVFASYSRLVSTCPKKGKT